MEEDAKISNSLELIAKAIQERQLSRARDLLLSDIVDKTLMADSLRRAISYAGILLDHSRYRRTLLTLLDNHKSRKGLKSYTAPFCQIYYGLEDWHGFAATSKGVELPYNTLTDKALTWARDRINSTAHPYPDYTREKIFCIGLSKTATTSVRKSLEIMGYASVHWRNPITSKILTQADINLFDAFSDISISYNFEYLYYAYHNSKFIYTVRDIGDWLNSFETHYEHLYGVSSTENILRRHHFLNRYENQVWLDSHYSLYMSARNPVEAYVRHENRVMDFFKNKPESRFLHLDVFAGKAWKELGEFVGSSRASSEKAFPWRNKYDQ